MIRIFRKGARLKTPITALFHAGVHDCERLWHAVAVAHFVPEHERLRLGKHGWHRVGRRLFDSVAASLVTLDALADSFRAELGFGHACGLRLVVGNDCAVLMRKRDGDHVTACVFSDLHWEPLRLFERLRKRKRLAERIRVANDRSKYVADPEHDWLRLCHGHAIDRGVSFAARVAQRHCVAIVKRPLYSKPLKRAEWLVEREPERVAHIKRR